MNDLENAKEKLEELFEFMEQRKMSIGSSAKRDGTVYVSVQGEHGFYDFSFNEEIDKYSINGPPSLLCKENPKILSQIKSM